MLGALPLLPSDVRPGLSSPTPRCATLTPPPPAPCPVAVHRHPQGGAIAQSRQGTLSMTRCQLLNNTAVYGGGLGCAQDLELTLTDVSIVNNMAVHGGGLECNQCFSVAATRVVLRGNAARSAGGAALTQLENGGTFDGCTFDSNSGLPANLLRLAEAGCARDAEGGGGALCVNLRQSVTLRGCLLTNNTAVSGGGAFVQQHCLAGDDGCGPLVVRDTVLRGNRALRGGGGAIFRTTHNLTDLYCPGQPSPLPWAALTAGCPGWTDNRAVYGDVTATIAYNLTLLTLPSIPLYRSNDLLNVSLELTDYHGQTIKGGMYAAVKGKVTTVQPHAKLRKQEWRPRRSQPP